VWVGVEVVRGGKRWGCRRRYLDVVMPKLIDFENEAKRKNTSSRTSSWDHPQAQGDMKFIQSKKNNG